MLFEATTFVAAALIRFDVLVHRFEHQTASIAESVIATVLLTGLGWSLAHGRSIPLATAPVPTARACSWRARWQKASSSKSPYVVIANALLLNGLLVTPEYRAFMEADVMLEKASAARVHSGQRRAARPHTGRT
jgi:hypothetical protein